MAPTHTNPYGLEDGMIVRSVAKPSKVFRVSGIPDRGRSTFVAVSAGTQTVMNGNAKNYRPETPDERAERDGYSDTDSDERTMVEHETVTDTDLVDDAPESDDFEIAELCVRMQDAVARVADGECDTDDAAAIVSAAAALNEAVVRRQLALGHGR